MADSVWIVGAGFSRHAGGPLMYDLFSETADVFLDAKDHSTLNALRNIGALFRTHLENGNRYWQNAEDFLEKLDALTDKRPSHSVVVIKLLESLKKNGVTSVRQLRRLAFSRMCKEVEDYITDTPKHSERLMPYKHWVQHLHESDTVITFNYDTLIETAARYASVNIAAPLPSAKITKGKLNLIKLHGSVSWSRDGSNNPEERESFNESFQHDLPEEKIPLPLIATPGSSKGRFMSDFAEQWSFAREAIQTARSIHIVGYRFPESDSAAAINLLLPLRECGGSCRVNIVLGTDVLKPETVRLKTLVDRNLQGSAESVIVHPMYAQDYLLLDNEWKKHRKAPKVLF